MVDLAEGPQAAPNRTAEPTVETRVRTVAHEATRSNEPIPLDGLAYGIDHLEAIIVFYLGDAQVHAAWVRADAGFRAEEVAPRLRDAYRACQSVVRGLDISAGALDVLQETFVTLETSSRVTLLKKARAYVVASLFDTAMPLGMARLMASRIAAAVEPELPLGEDVANRSAIPIPKLPFVPQGNEEAAKTLAAPTPIAGHRRPGASKPPPPRPTLTELDRARRLLAYLEANAPEPHVVRLRVALRAGLTPLALEHPEALAADAIVLIETAVQDILGVDRSVLRSMT